MKTLTSILIILLLANFNSGATEPEKKEKKDLVIIRYLEPGKPDTVRVPAMYVGTEMHNFVAATDSTNK